MRLARTRKYILLFLAVFFGCFISLSLFTDFNNNLLPPKSQRLLIPLNWIFALRNSAHADEIACYTYGGDLSENDVVNDEASFKRLSSDYMEELSFGDVVRNSSIFFHETSCHAGTGQLLNSRMACAVESAAKANPESQVYVLFPSPILMKNYQNNSFIKELTSYDNVHLLHINMDRYFENSPLEYLYKSGMLLTSDWPGSHASDLLRYVTLWRFGGIYLDLDVVVIKSLQGMTNFAGAESETAVAAGVLSFSIDGIGKELAELCVKDLQQNFRGYDWGYNGPGVITRVLKRICKVDEIKDMYPDRCKGFHVYPPSWFYPIPWRQWKLYFEFNQSVIDNLENSHIIHVWNKHSKCTAVKVGSDQPYGIFAEKYCPKVYKASGSTF